MLAGMTPTCVRIDWREPLTAGLVTIDWGDGVTRESARAVLVGVLLGAMTEGWEGWDTYPPTRTGSPSPSSAT
jgi:hypothetical protein